MWTTCCHKLCRCCCLCCPWCWCRVKEGDLVELLTGSEGRHPDTQYYTVRKVGSMRATTSQDDIDSSVDLQGTTQSTIPRGNAREQLGVSPAVYWMPKIYKVQPELDTSIDSGTASTGYSSKSRSQWHRALHTIRPMVSHHENVHLERGGGSGDAINLNLPPITMSAPDLVADDLRHRRKLISPSKSSPKLRHTNLFTDNSQKKQASWLKSQSMQDINSMDESDSSRKEPNEKALTYGINTSLYTMDAPAYPTLAKSNDALNARRTAGEENCYVEPSYGEVHFSVAYIETSKKLLVHVAKVKHLPPKGVCYKYNVVLKVNILPNAKQEKMTRAVSGNLGPNFSEEFQFLVKELAGRVLRVSAYDADLMGPYDAIGHALYYLEDVPPNRRATHSMKLYKQSQPDQFPGSLEVSLHYDSKRDKLTVNVMQARNLALSPQVTHNWRSIDNFNTYVKVAYFSAGQKIKSRRSPPVMSTRNPVYDYTSEFILASNCPYEIYMVITVVLPGLLRKDHPIGRLIFGPFYYADDETETPWGRAIRSNEVVTHWYNMYL